ncbi:siderophore-interacting protein [uncultured Georgenia sp.]|uniref:siderophore-interacting protein n=1 Tax=uncultured Georgenia sp. TaxID=378209 RepID=UPI0026248D51|nr:siderophore-interacting protein [uncultured Georgenia sp.]HLV02989.1 siderophore-interacting protein [Actinomycetaceae bacterium]
MSTASSPSIRQERVRHLFTSREMTVTAWRDITPRIRRLTLAGPMEGFTSLGPGDHVKVFFPDPDTGVLNAPRVVDGRLERPEGQVIARDYTPLVNEAGQLELDVVIHGDSGPASAWAAGVTEGARIVVAGPRGSKLPPEGADWYVLAGDETALPAISRWLRVLPADADVTVLAEVQDAADEAYLAELGSPHRVTYLHRGTAEPGTTTLIADAVRALPRRDGAGFWWLAGEAQSLVPARRYLRRELGLDAAAVDCSGYWKRGIAEHDHHAPVDPTDP